MTGPDPDDYGRYGQDWRPGQVAAAAPEAELTPAQQAILDSFEYHVPTAEQGERIASLRKHFRALAARIMRTTRPCADQTAALRQLHEAMMTANKAIVLEPAPQNDAAGDSPRP